MAVVVGVAVGIVYSRGYTQWHKPLVQVVLPQSDIFYWRHEARSEMRASSAAEREGGIVSEWVAENTVTHEEYKDSMEELELTSASLTTDGGILPNVTRDILMRTLDSGDVVVVLGDTGIRQSWGGEGVSVLIEYHGANPIGNLIPPEAIYTDSRTGELYVFVLERRDSIAVRGFYAKRVDITIGIPIMVGELMYISSPDLENASIIISSDEAIFDGSAVRIYR